jgi:hypothetical protein
LTRQVRACQPPGRGYDLLSEDGRSLMSIVCGTRLIQYIRSTDPGGPHRHRPSDVLGVRHFGPVRTYR